MKCVCVCAVIEKKRKSRGSGKKKERNQTNSAVPSAKIYRSDTSPGCEEFNPMIPFTTHLN